MAKNIPVSSGSERPTAWRIKAAARQLGVCPATIYNLRRAGKLRLVKIGARTVVPDSEVLRLANEGGVRWPSSQMAGFRQN